MTFISKEQKVYFRKCKDNFIISDKYKNAISKIILLILLNKMFFGRKFVIIFSKRKYFFHKLKRSVIYRVSIKASFLRL